MRKLEYSGTGTGSFYALCTRYEPHQRSQHWKPLAAAVIRLDVKIRSIIIFCQTGTLVTLIDDIRVQPIKAQARRGPHKRIKEHYIARVAVAISFVHLPLLCFFFY